MKKKRQSILTRIVFVCVSVCIVATVLVGLWINLQVMRPVTSQGPLSQEEYKKLQHTLTRIVIDSSPREALERLEKEMSSNPHVGNSCHGLVHEIGHMAYVKNGNFAEAVAYQNDICGSGYLHGVIEQHFTKSLDIITTMKTVCGNTAVTVDGKCLHGVGHGLMFYTNNDLSQSLSLCNSYSVKSARNYCSEGVFMENFSSLQEFHPTKYLDPQNPFYPCPTISSPFKDSCYFYAPEYYLSLHPREYVQALTWCNSAESNYQNRCISGVGSRAMKQNLFDPSYVEAICLQGKTEEEVKACVDGMVSYHLVNYNSTKQTEKMCFSLTSRTQNICFSSLKQRWGLFNN